jgi:hypothetical protein
VQVSNPIHGYSPGKMPDLKTLQQRLYEEDLFHLIQLPPISNWQQPLKISAEIKNNC